jgi:protein gp37
MSTHIEWTDHTWNPGIGCEKVSPGCTHCYAETASGSGRLKRLPAYKGLVELGSDGRSHWTGEVRFLPERLAGPGSPLRVRKPSKFFVGSMTDLFHPGYTNEQIAAVFGVMAACPQHTFQVLTKRPERALEWFAWLKAVAGLGHPVQELMNHGVRLSGHSLTFRILLPSWPLPNVWFGASVEDQQRADERIPLLLKIPAAVRWMSMEPMLGPVHLHTIDTMQFGGAEFVDALRGHAKDFMGVRVGSVPRIHWVVCGGESGRGHRDMDPAWARSIQSQCEDAAVPFFMKQMAGKRPIPADLMVRQWPREAT